VCDDGNVVFYTGDEKVAYYRSPVSVRGIGTPTGDAHAETKKVAAQRDQFQQRMQDLERVVEGLRNERDDWKAESHRLQVELRQRPTWEELDEALEGARESRDHWKAESHRLHEELCERPTQEDLDAAVTALKGARDYWRDKYQDKDKAALGKIRELQQELETTKEGGEYWYKEYWQLLSTSSAGSLQQELETAKEQYRQLLSSLSVEELNKAQEQVQHWKDKYTELHREVHVALRDKAFWQTRHKEAEATIKDLRQENNKQVQFWKKRYKQAVAEITDLNQDLNSSEKQSASLEDLREAQRERDSWHRKYILPAAKRND
jgi:chromosome segregation ATPase